MRIERLSLTEWEDELPASGFEPFHAAPALSVLGEHSAAEMVLLGGYKGQHLVGLFPAFVREKSVGKAILSPPPSLGVTRLGPLVLPNSPKRRKQEKVNIRFTEGVIDELDADGRFSFLRLIGSTEYTDPRPYIWNDFEISPSFTYRIDVGDSSLEEIRRSFSKDLRKDVAQAEDLDLQGEGGGVDAARAVYDQTASRYEEQDRSFSLPWPYIRDLVSELDERCRVYTVSGPDGEFLNGLIVLYSNDAAYSWVGGTRADYRNISVNGYLQWRIIEGLFEDPPFDSIHAYDLTGANTRRLCNYKATFGGELAPYFVVESKGQSMDVAKKAYQVVSR
jgi:hypothetical protein